MKPLSFCAPYAKAQPRLHQPKVPQHTLTKFFISTLEAFFARQHPVSSMAKPACMNITRAPQRQSQAESRAPPRPRSAFCNLAIFSSMVSVVSLWRWRGTFSCSITSRWATTSAFNSSNCWSRFCSKDKESAAAAASKPARQVHVNFMAQRKGLLKSRSPTLLRSLCYKCLRQKLLLTLFTLQSLGIALACFHVSSSNLSNR